MIMSEISIVDYPDRNLWNSFLDNQFPGDLWQTIDYGEINKISYPYTSTVRILVLQDNAPEAIVQGIYNRFFGFGTILTVREGPVISAKNGNKHDLLKNTLCALEDFGVRKRIIKIQVLWPQGWESHDVYRHLGYEPTSKSINYVVNLNFGVEDLWKHIHHNKRKNIKKALSKGVEVREANDYADIQRFLNLYIAAAKRHELHPPLFSWFEAFWKLRRSQTKIFFAKWNGKDVSGVFITIHGKIIYALSAGSLSEGFEARPNDMLHWKVMEWGCEQGYSRYHMGEVHPDLPKYQNIWRWKREWNGDLEVVLHYEKNISKYPLITQMYKIFKKK
jgi:hypothetical protein